MPGAVSEAGNAALNKTGKRKVPDLAELTFQSGRQKGDK